MERYIIMHVGCLLKSEGTPGSSGETHVDSLIEIWPIVERWFKEGVRTIIIANTTEEMEASLKKGLEMIDRLNKEGKK